MIRQILLPRSGAQKRIVVAPNVPEIVNYPVARGAAFIVSTPVQLRVIATDSSGGETLFHPEAGVTRIAASDDIRSLTITLIGASDDEEIAIWHDANASLRKCE